MKDNIIICFEKIVDTTYTQRANVLQFVVFGAVVLSEFASYPIDDIGLR